MSESTDTAERTYTIDEFYRLPDDGCRMDLVRGRIVREPPAGFEHGHMDFRIGAPIYQFVEAHRLGVALGAETGFILSEDPPTVRAPDVAFVAEDRLPDEGLPTGYFPGPPDLAVEVVSPSNTAAEIQEKVIDYIEAGTRLVWVVYPRTRTVVAHGCREGSRTLCVGEDLDGGDVLPGFRLPVAELFPR